MSNRFSAAATSVAEGGRNMNSSYNNATYSCHVTHNYATNATHSKGMFQQTMIGGIDDDDDDIFQSLDVDQIVTEHYQSSCTPPSSSTLKFSLVMPASSSSVPRHDDISLPPKICVDCSHGVKLGLCVEASSHLQLMKDKPISISNDLLDNFDLNSDQIEKLCHLHCQLH